jgi:mannosyl-oligosaccharide glucosidase
MWCIIEREIRKDLPVCLLGEVGLIVAEGITSRVKELSKEFHERFTRLFKLTEPFTATEYTVFAKQALSSLLGGTAYFHGTSLVSPLNPDDSDTDSPPPPPVQSGPYELFTLTPSRPFFPRGFYWDEGFHLLPLVKWDPMLAVEVLKSWFGLMDSEGWIAREQILGQEARKKVPLEFQVQNPEYANPPTLLFPLEGLLDIASSSEGDSLGQIPLGDTPDTATLEDLASGTMSPDVARAYLSQLYPLLVRHFTWFRKTQYGEIKSWDREAFSSKEGYRWRGRTTTHCLTSGLDDYPRCEVHPAELNVDLLSWMGYFAGRLRRIAEAVGEEVDGGEYAKVEEAVKRNLEGTMSWLRG